MTTLRRLAVAVAALGALLTMSSTANAEPLSYFGGEVSNHPHVYLTFWGKNWDEHTGARAEVENMFLHLSGSRWQGMLTQYYDGSGAISIEVGVSSWTDRSIAAPNDVNETHLVNEIEYALTQQPWPGGGINNVYLVLPAPGSKFEAGFGGCGAHHYSLSLGVPYGYVFWPGDQPGILCSGNDPSGESRNWVGEVMTASHEYAEAVTDPITPAANGGVKTGWIDNADGSEVADKCNDLFGGTLENGSYVVQLWDNGRNGCYLQVNGPLVQTGGLASYSGHEAIVNGSVHPNGVTSNYHVEYGTTTGYGSSSQLYGAGSGWEYVPVSATLSNIKGSTTYHYRFVAQNAEGTRYGEDQTFTTPDWRPVVVNEPATNVGAEAATFNGTVNPEGASTQYHFEYGRTTSYGTNVPVPDEGVGSGTEAVAVHQTPSGLHPEVLYHRRLVASNAEGTSTSNDRTFTARARAATFYSTIGAPGWGSGKFEEPSGMARDSKGNVWVADTMNDRVEEFNAKGEFLREFGSSGSAPGRLDEPRDVAVAPNGHIWVTDARNSRIEEFDAQGFYIRQWGPENQSFALTKPYGIETGGTPTETLIWVTDPGGQRIVEFKATSQKIEQVQTWTGGGAPANPAGITRDAQENLWIVDPVANRVYKLSSGGTLTSVFGSAGSGASQLSEPYGIAVRPSGNLVIAERGNNRVQLFTPGGEYLGGFGTQGTAENQMTAPRDVLATPSGTIYVSDTGNNRLKNWGIPWEPLATTGSASSIGTTEATLGASVNPSCAATTYYFEYGTTTSYGTTSATQSAGSGCEAAAASKAISGLQPGTVYHFRIVATSAEGTTSGEDKTFTTVKPPPPDTTITGGSTGKVTPDVSFTFNASEDGVSYECALDAGSYSSCTSPKTYEGLSEGSHTFKVRAVGPGGADPTPAERTVTVVETAKAVSGIAVLDAFGRSENPLATPEWTKTSWATKIGASWTGSWHGYGGWGGTLVGAYWNPASFSDASAGLLVSATLGTGPTASGEYMSLWLDMPNPGSARSGYEVRFTGTGGSTYKVELSKWASGTRTVLETKEAVSLAKDTTFALTETGGRLTLWTGTTSFSRVLTAYDSTYSSGYAGLEVYGGNGTAYNFRAGGVQ
jgi:DNA-binding beta-propeller fold protein YncE